MTTRAKVFEEQPRGLPAEDGRFLEDQHEVVVRCEGRRIVPEPVDAWPGPRSKGCAPTPAGRPPTASRLRLTVLLAIGLLVGCGARVVYDDGGTSSSSGTSPSSAGSGTLCGCDVNAICGDPYHHCSASEPAECIQVPGECPSDVLPSCGCDGHVYSSECEAHRAGVDLDWDTRCGASAGPPGTIPCGPYYCDASTTYCHRTTPRCYETAECRPLPAACSSSSPTCGCVHEPDEWCSETLDSPAQIGKHCECSLVDGNGATGLEVSCDGHVPG